MHCISIIIAIFLLNDKFYIGCHFDNVPKSYRYKKISSCGGNVEKNETFIQGAIREAREEHGLIIDKQKLRLIYTKNTNYKIYKYYMVNVTPNDYYNNGITTPIEIFKEKNYINNVFSQFPPNSVINTKVDTTFLIDYDVLKSSEFKHYILPPFQKFLQSSHFKNALLNK